MSDLFSSCGPQKHDPVLFEMLEEPCDHKTVFVFVFVVVPLYPDSVQGTSLRLK